MSSVRLALVAVAVIAVVAFLTLLTSLPRTNAAGGSQTPEATLVPTPEATPVPTPASTAPRSPGELAEQLRSKGAMVEVDGEIEQAFFSVTGNRLVVNGQDVQVFAYPDKASAAKEAATVSPDGGSIGTSMVMWVATPHFFKGENLIVLYVGDDGATLQGLRGVFGEQFAGR